MTEKLCFFRHIKQVFSQNDISSCHFQENNWQHLLSIIKFECKVKIIMFWKIISIAASLTASYKTEGDVKYYLSLIVQWNVSKCVITA